MQNTSRPARHRRAAGLLVLSCLVAMPGHAQVSDAGAAGQSGRGQDSEAGRTADTGSGEVGQRQTREDTAPNVEPMRRIETRLSNRIQNRMQTRIDRDYRPPADATSAFEVAGEQTRRAGRTPRR